MSFLDDSAKEELRRQGAVLAGLFSDDGDKSAVVSATVSRVDDDGTVWVSIGDQEAPVAQGIKAKLGDKVSVRLADGSATITDNTTRPATDDATAIIAHSAALDAQDVADQAMEVAGAIGQHFWHDENGAHVSTEADNPAGERNVLLNSLGMLFRNGLNNLLAIVTGSATDPVDAAERGVAIYDGLGNAASNIVAWFGRNAARIGKQAKCISLSASGIDFFDDSRAVMRVVALSGTQSQIQVPSGVIKSVNLSNETSMEIRATEKVQEESSYYAIPQVDIGAIMEREYDDDFIDGFVRIETDKNAARMHFGAEKSDDYGVAFSAAVIDRGDDGFDTSFQVRGDIVLGKYGSGRKEVAIDVETDTVSQGDIIKVVEGSTSKRALLVGDSSGSGTTAVGSGEYIWGYYYYGDMFPTTGNLMLGAGGAVHIESNAATFGNRKTWRFKSNGQVQAPSAIDGTYAPSAMTDAGHYQYSYVPNEHNVRSFARQSTTNNLLNMTEVGRYINGAWVWNTFAVGLLEDGTRMYSVSDPAAFREAIGLGTEVLDCVKDETKVTSDSVIKVARSGNAAQVRFGPVKLAVEWPSQTNVTIGTLPSGIVPAVASQAQVVIATRTGYVGYAGVNALGAITIRNQTGAAIAAGASLYATVPLILS